MAPPARTPNRRELLQGTAGALLVTAVRRPAGARAAVIPTDLRADVTHRGRALALTRRGTHVVAAHAGRPTLEVTQRRTRRTRTVKLAGHPLELAVSPGDALIAVTTAFWDHPGLELVHLRDPDRHARLDVGPAPFAPAFTHDRKHLLVTGGEQDGSLRILRAPDFARGRVLAIGRVPRGLAVTQDDSAAWVALHGDEAVVRISLRSGRVTRRVATAPLPDRVALSPDGHHLLVSHGGHGAASVSQIDTRTGKVTRMAAGGAVSAVAWGAKGRRLAALQDDGAIVVLGARTPRRTATVPRPRGLVVVGGHAFTVSAVTGRVGRVRV